MPFPLRSSNSIIWAHLAISASCTRDGLELPRPAPELYRCPQCELFWSGKGSRFPSQSMVTESLAHPACSPSRLSQTKRVCGKVRLLIRHSVGSGSIRGRLRSLAVSGGDGGSRTPGASLVRATLAPALTVPENQSGSDVCASGPPWVSG